MKSLLAFIALILCLETPLRPADSNQDGALNKVSPCPKIPTDSVSIRFQLLWNLQLQSKEPYTNLTLYPPPAPRVIEGDFFGDGQLDFAFQAKDSTGAVKIIFLDQSLEQELIYLTGKEGGLNSNDFSWAEVFRTAKAGEALWSNYTDDYRSFDSIPKDEIVYLDYDALYAHLAEACGGGFIYWQDSVFHWLQQE